VSHLSIVGLPPVLLEESISQLLERGLQVIELASDEAVAHQLLVRLDRVALFSHLHNTRARFWRWSYWRRVSTLQLMHYSEGLRSEMLSSTLCGRIMTGCAPSHWMLACSDSDEQYWLNTCAATAVNLALTHHAATLATLLVLAHTIATRIKRQLQILQPDADAHPSLWPGSSPSVVFQVLDVLAKVRERLNEVEEHGM
jgi:hypothetical protein